MFSDARYNRGAALGPPLIAHNVYYVKLWKAAKKAGSGGRPINWTSDQLCGLERAIYWNRQVVN